MNDEPPPIVVQNSRRILHLCSLRRHDPDQVRWVGADRLSARRQPDTPRDCCAISSPRAFRRQERLASKPPFCSIAGTN